MVEFPSQRSPVICLEFSSGTKKECCQQVQSWQTRKSCSKTASYDESTSLVRSLKKKKQVEKEKLSEQHFITSVDELSPVMSEIDDQDCTTASKKSRKIAVIRTQVNIRKKISKQSIDIAFTRARKQRPVPFLILSGMEYNTIAH